MIPRSSSQQHHTQVDMLFNQKTLEQFYYSIKNQMKYEPSMIAENLRRLRIAIQFLMHNTVALIIVMKTVHEKCTT